MGLSDWLKGKKSNHRKTAQQKDTLQPETISAGADKPPYIGIRCSTTGYFCHSFQNINGEVFTAGSMVVPNPDISLKGFGKVLCCNVDPQITLFPGIRRNVTDAHGNYYGSYIYSAPHAMCLQIEDKNINVTVSNMGWIFYSGSEEVAKIIRLSEEYRTKGYENGFDTEKMYSVEISESLNINWYPLILGTPMIGF